MADKIDTEIRWAKVSELSLDPRNPRLGSDKISQNLSEPLLLEEMKEWELEELAVSFLESGFWPQEALIVVEEKERNGAQKIVIEGNRRLAALKWLKNSFEGHPPSPKWAEMVKGRKYDARIKKLFSDVPYFVVADRDAVTGYLGFRHVSGIKEWEPREKAAFIAHMIDDLGLSYEQVMRRIGSKTEPVRRNYWAHKVFLQMQGFEEIDASRVRDRFSVLFLSLRGAGVQDYLGIEVNSPPHQAKDPVKKNKIKQLINYAKWLFGSDLKGVYVNPIVSDSRQVDRFDKCLANSASRAYLERTSNPDLNDAYKIAGGEEFETLEDLEQALTHVKRALAVIHAHRKSSRIREAVLRVSRATLELLRGYPEDRANILEEDEDLVRPVRQRSR